MPPLIFWDASGLLKRYFVETGSRTVDELFRTVPGTQMLVTVWEYAECYAVLHRKRNGGQMDGAALAEAVTSLQDEVLTSGDIRLLSIEDERVLAGLSYVTRDSLNSNDAPILATYVRYRQHLPPGGPACVLVASDERLLRAAQAEGFVGLNPERIADADVASFLSSL